MATIEKTANAIATFVLLLIFFSLCSIKMAVSEVIDG